MVNGLIKDIKGYHIHFCSSSNSPIEKSYGGYIVSPVIADGPILVMNAG